MRKSLIVRTAEEHSSNTVHSGNIGRMFTEDAATTSRASGADSCISYSVQCPGCDQTFYSNSDLAKHCEERHKDGCSENE
ncbi:hypothetical protein RB195_018747 [Necator americanus]|uniref:C2H2-type domain-containing protein n=1 Tax=Necator americanus TaxID=51031 RepID=A0ABR1CER8_NECAM